MKVVFNPVVTPNPQFAFERPPHKAPTNAIPPPRAYKFGINSDKYLFVLDLVLNIYSPSLLEAIKMSLEPGVY